MKKILALALVAMLCMSMFSSCNRASDADVSIPETHQEADVNNNSNEAVNSEDADVMIQPATGENLITAMTDAEKRKINTFISNFTEAHCREHGDEVANNDFYKINFAYVHNIINKPGQTIIYNEILGKFGIDEEEVDSVLEKYFGKSVPHKTTTCTEQYEIEGKFVVNEEVYEYADGVFWINAASGESYEYFAIVYDMTGNGDGTYDVQFNEYWDEAHMYEGMQPQWYSYTVEEADEYCKPVGTGRAKVRKKEYNGEQTYELISFKAG